MTRTALLIALASGTLATAGLAGVAGARWLRPAPGLGPAAPQEDPRYDGRFTFVRIRFGEDGGGLRNFQGFGRRGRGREPVWAHDTPYAEQNFAKILDATTFVDNYKEGLAGRNLTTDDPELSRYPLAFMVEVGYWTPSEAEVEGLRDYLLKGGFLIVDDFRGEGALRNFLYHMERVLPGARVVEVPDDHDIFDSFFHIAEPQSLTPPYNQELHPFYLGFHEDNDPSKRLMVIMNYNNDHMEYWEYSERGYYPIDLANEAYKFGVNYVIYALTH
ncbi:MAG TPA: DUF4159 domain-containing protein [Longimicrobiales bacterium]|jgi:hypothetical protein